MYAVDEIKINRSKFGKLEESSSMYGRKIVLTRAIALALLLGERNICTSWQKEHEFIKCGLHHMIKVLVNFDLINF